MNTHSTSSRIKGLIASVIELVQVRFQLLTIEAREELLRVLGMIAFGAMAVVLLCMGLMFFALLIVANYWDTPARLWAVGGVAIGFLGIAGICAAFAWNQFNRGTQLFSSSLRELTDDVERLQA